MIITFGELVYLDRHDGIAIGKRGTRASIWNHRDAKLINIEKLFDVSGWETIVALVADHYEANPDDVLSHVALARADYNNVHVRNCWHGGAGPLAEIEDDEISVERLRIVERDLESAAAGRQAKRHHTAVRRSQFNSVRSDLVLRMLDAGIVYRCAHPGCDMFVNLTIDHKLALSRGGTDDLSNLQFMCGPHNSKKRDGP